MRRGVASGTLRVLAAFGWLTFPFMAAGIDCPARQVLTEVKFLEVASQYNHVLGVQWGLNGSFVAADGQQDGFVFLNTSGALTGFQPLNLAPFNLTPGGGRLYFFAFDSSGRSILAYAKDSTVVQQVLPSNFLGQGGLLTVGPDGSGIAFSNALASLVRFDRNLVLSPPHAATFPGRAAAMATWNGVTWLAFGSSSGSGLGAVQPDGTVQVRYTLPNFPTVMEPCGDNLLIGGVQLLAQAHVSSSGQIVLDFTPTTLTFRGLSCLPGGDVMYVADGRVAGIRSASGTLQSYTVPGTGSLTGIASAPGPNATALLLNSTTTQGVPILGNLPYLGALFRNCSACRKPNELLMLVTPQIISDR